jgi:hypothetical protein
LRAEYLRIYISLQSMTTEIKNKITQLHSFIDEAFDANKTATYQLLLQIGTSDILVGIHDKHKNKYIALEKYALANIHNFDGVAELLDILLNESKLVSHKFQAVSCILVSNLSTLVPNALFEDDRKRMYLKFNATLEGDELVVVDEIRSLDAKNVFAIPFSIKAKLDAQYREITYHHASSTLIETLVANHKNQTGKKLFVHVQNTHFETILIEGKNLIFYNTFNYQSPEDFIYYLLFVCEQMQLNPEKTETILLGEIEKTSAIYNLSQKYIRTIKFGERTDGSEFSYQLQTLPKHFYFTLFNSYLA